MNRRAFILLGATAPIAAGAVPVAAKAVTVPWEPPEVRWLTPEHAAAFRLVHKAAQPGLSWQQAIDGYELMVSQGFLPRDRALREIRDELGKRLKT